MPTLTHEQEIARAIRRKIRNQGQPAKLPSNIVFSHDDASAPDVEATHADDLSIENLDLTGIRRRVGTKKGKKGKRLPIYDRETAKVTGSILDAVVERTIEGASTLTITLHDPEWHWLNSGIFDADEFGELDAIDVKLDKLWFRLVSVEPSGDDLTLIFEDREVAFLRQHNKPRSVSRADSTRAQFVELLVREVKAARIRYYSPEKNTKPSIAKTKTEPSGNTASRRTSRSRSAGIARGAKLTVKGAPADANQRRNMELVLTQCAKDNAGAKATLAAVIACIVEDLFRNSLKVTDGTSVGILQLLSSHLGGSVSTKGGRRDIGLVVHMFLADGFAKYAPKGAIELARANPGWTAGQIAQACQGSDYPERYDLYREEGRKIIAAFGGPVSESDSGSSDASASVTRIKQYRFRRGERGKREDSWTCMQRLAAEVNWRCFMRNGEVWFISEPRLLRQTPLAIIKRTTDGVDSGSIRFKWDTGKRVKEVSFDIRADRWAFPPGSVVELSGFGPASSSDPRWIVSKITRSLYDSNTSITLVKSTKPQPEPAAETSSVGAGGNAASRSAGRTSGGSGGVAPPLTHILNSSNGYTAGHDGVDLICSPNAVIFAICDARVVDVRAGGWWGKNPTGNVSIGDGIIVLECLITNGPFRVGFKFGYGHAEKAKVRVGQTVKAGEQIGHAGFANAWHVHFMVNGTGPGGRGDRNPMPYVNYAIRHGRGK